jgi:hypothetical protein
MKVAKAALIRPRDENIHPRIKTYIYNITFQKEKGKSQRPRHLFLHKAAEK